MIYLLLRETHIEVPELGTILVERTPLGAFQNLELIDTYTNQKGYKKTGKSTNATFTRDIDLIKIRDQFAKYFQTKIPMKATEIFVIHGLDLRS